jgi:hypothetical protein
VSIWGTLGASLLAVLARPSTWAFGLLGFLVRGGWLLVAAPIVVVPTPIGLANVVAPVIEDIAFGRRTTELALLAGAIGAVALVWLVGGGLIAAAAEAEAVREVAEEEGLPVHGHAAARRILAARLLALIPLAIGVTWAVTRIVAVAYRELTVPSDVAVPAAWRIVTGAPEAFVIVALTYLFSEIVGAVSARRIMLAGDGPIASLRAGERLLRTRPGRSLALALITNAVVIVVLITTGLAASATWDAVGMALGLGDVSALTTLLLIAFVGLFIGGLILTSLACAWRAAVWTLDQGGTFGGGSGTRSSG